MGVGLGLLTHMNVCVCVPLLCKQMLVVEISGSHDGKSEDGSSEVHTASIIILMREAVCTSELSVYFNKTTQCYIPEGCHFHMYVNKIHLFKAFLRQNFPVLIHFYTLHQTQSKRTKAITHH
jgi:hypothetical protein